MTRFAAQTFLPGRVASRRHDLRSVIASLAVLPARCRLWMTWRQELLALRDLDDRLLRDIGATREDAARPFWRL